MSVRVIDGVTYDVKVNEETGDVTLFLENTEDIYATHEADQDHFLGLQDGTYMLVSESGDAVAQGYFKESPAFSAEVEGSSIEFLGFLEQADGKVFHVKSTDETVSYHVEGQENLVRTMGEENLATFLGVDGDKIAEGIFTTGRNITSRDGETQSFDTLETAEGKCYLFKSGTDETYATHEAGEAHHLTLQADNTTDDTTVLIVSDSGDELARGDFFDADAPLNMAENSPVFDVVTQEDGSVVFFKDGENVVHSPEGQGEPAKEYPSSVSLMPLVIGSVLVSTFSVTFLFSKLSGSRKAALKARRAGKANSNL